MDFRPRSFAVFAVGAWCAGDAHAISGGDGSGAQLPSQANESFAWAALAVGTTMFILIFVLAG